MKELIVKITDKNPDIEVLYNNFFKEEVIEKSLSLKAFLEIVNDSQSSSKDLKCEYMHPSIIGFAEDGINKKYIINQPAHRRYITYSVNNENRGYSINFPSSIYIVYVNKNKVRGIEAYMYLEWKDLCTKLYRYAMPNMLMDNKMCIGNANKEIKESIIDALETIIYAPYSHEFLNNIKTFRNTKDYFDYLTAHEIEKKHLHDAQKLLKDLF